MATRRRTGKPMTSSWGCQTSWMATASSWERPWRWGLQQVVPAVRGEIVGEVIQGDLAGSSVERGDDDVHVGVAGGPGVARSSDRPVLVGVAITGWETRADALRGVRWFVVVLKAG